MKATEQFLTAVLFIKLCKVVLPFESVDEIPICDHSSESYCTVPFSSCLLGCTRSFCAPELTSSVRFLKKATE